MLNFLSLKLEAFGLDISDSSLKIIKLEKERRGFSVSSFNSMEIKRGVVEIGIIKDEKTLAKIIKSAYEKAKGKKIQTKYVVASLPEEESFLQVIQMPRMSPEELKSAVIFEVENYIPLPIDQVYLDFQAIAPIKDGLDHIDVLVVATPKHVVNSYVSCLKSAGLIPLILESESQSTIRALVKDETSECPLVALDLGENKTDFIVFAGRSIRFTHSIPISQRQLDSSISQLLKVDLDKAKKMKIRYGIAGERGKIGAGSKKVSQAAAPVLEEMASQIKKYINFYEEHASHEHLLCSTGIKKILLCGGGANLNGLPEFLAKRLALQVEIGDPFINLPRAKKDKAGSIDFLPFTAALGLAARGTDNKKENM